MELEPALSGIGCALALTGAAYSRERDPIFLGVALTASWAATALAYANNTLEQLAVMDGAMWALGISLYRMQPERWRYWFMVLAGVQFILDIVYVAVGPDIYAAYRTLYNASFAGELIVVGATGGKDAIRSAWSRLRRILPAISSRSGAR